MASPVELVGRKLGHYLIKQQIGAGGMGVVFLAHDERLERDVAIKVLPGSTFADQSVRKRFRKEALTLSKLNHPNIATIFDFDEENEICFLVTEYISGPSVDIVVNAGALPESQIISLGLQLTDALIAAHDKGVVHCDLKPENLRLTPDGRLKVLDFGIARLMHTATDENMATMTMTMTQTNEIRGTLPYMAPEQLLGEPPDARTDIWATGAVLYQLSSGSRPFQGKVATALAAEIIHTAPPQLAGLKKGISPLLEGTIMKCLEKKAEHRYQTARELKVDLDRVLTRQGTMPMLAPKISDAISDESDHKFSWKLATACLFLGLLIVGGWYWYQHRPRAAAKSSQRQSVAVLGFANATANKQDDWISSILTTQLPTELAAGGKIRIISDEDVGRAKQDLSLNVSGSLAGDTLGRINRRLNADLIVVGSYSNLDGNLLVNLYVQDTRTGETIASPSQRGNVKDIEQLITSTGIELRQKLNIDQVDAATAELMRASMPSNTQAAQDYAEGVAKLRMSDALSARDLLEKAITADPNYAMAHSALAAAWDQLGYDAKKQEEAKKAFDLSSKLLREQKLLVEARYREVTSEWDKAVDIYRNLQNIAPDELDYGLRLAFTQIRGGKAQEAISTIQKLRTLPVPQRDDPRIDMAEAEASDSLSDFKATKDATERTIQKAQQIGARALTAQASWRECWALVNLGNLDNARAAGQRALQIYKETSDQLGQARSLTCMANVLTGKGDSTAALELHEQALSLTTSIGAKRDSAGATINIANILSDRGDLNGAIQRYQQVIAIAREIDDKGQLIIAENNLGIIYRNQGKYDIAVHTFDSARQTAKEVGDFVGSMQARLNLSAIGLQQGNLREAKDIIQEAIAAAKQAGDQSSQAGALQILGDILLAQDDLSGADQAYSESLNIQNSVGDKAGIANSQWPLAVLELERSQPAKAESLAGQAADEFASEKNGDSEAVARTVKAKALLAQSKIKEAALELDRVGKLNIGERTYVLEYLLAQALLLEREGQATLALGKLREASKEAGKTGLMGELETKLVLGQIQKNSGNLAAGKATLRSVEQQASQKGLKLLVRKAQIVASSN
ncbi:MAG TPA: protein kinase [Terriglobales bacterium]|nr:protein kinase [Terriglobales bacterium]